MAKNGSNGSEDLFDEWEFSVNASNASSSADTPENAWSALGASEGSKAQWQESELEAAQREKPTPFEEVRQPVGWQPASNPTQQFAQNNRPESYVPSPVAAPAPSTGSDNRALTVAVITLTVIAIMLLVGGLAYFYFSGSKDSPVASSSSSTTAESQPAFRETTTVEATTTQRRRAENFSAPSSWKHCSGSGDAGDLNLVYAQDVGGNITTCEFATNVRNAFVERYQMTQELDATVTASSPATGKTYTMTCRDKGDYVTCTGGNNATVHIV